MFLFQYKGFEQAKEVKRKKLSWADDNFDEF